MYTKDEVVVLINEIKKLRIMMIVILTVNIIVTLIFIKVATDSISQSLRFQKMYNTYMTGEEVSSGHKKGE